LLYETGNGHWNFKMPQALFQWKQVQSTCHSSLYIQIFKQRA